MTTVTPIAALCPALYRSAARPFRVATTSVSRPAFERHAVSARRPTSKPFSTTARAQQSLHASRTLRVPRSVIFRVISDVGAYSEFVPYCQRSEVTQRSRPARDGRRYPEEARLTIGFSEGVSEAFTSRVYCVPEQLVEAVSGPRSEASAAVSSSSPEDIAHHSPRPPASRDPSRTDTVLAHLSTRWTLRSLPVKPPPARGLNPTAAAAAAKENAPPPTSVSGHELTEVSLAIDFQFANPLLAALSAAAAHKVAEKMIEAFEKRITAVVEG